MAENSDISDLTRRIESVVAEGIAITAILHGDKDSTNEFESTLQNVEGILKKAKDLEKAYQNAEDDLEEDYTKQDSVDALQNAIHGYLSEVLQDAEQLVDDLKP